MYKPVDTSLNFVEREKEVLAFWKENEIFEKSVEKNKGGKSFNFYDGPPTANGKPHIGHILTRVSAERRAGTLTVCPWNSRWRSCWASTASRR